MNFCTPFTFIFNWFSYLSVPRAFPGENASFYSFWIWSNGFWLELLGFHLIQFGNKKLQNSSWELRLQNALWEWDVPKRLLRRKSLKNAETAVNFNRNWFSVNFNENNSQSIKITYYDKNQTIQSLRTRSLISFSSSRPNFKRIFTGID